MQGAPAPLHATDHGPHAHAPASHTTTFLDRLTNTMAARRSLRAAQSVQPKDPDPHSLAPPPPDMNSPQSIPSDQPPPLCNTSQGSPTPSPSPIPIHIPPTAHSPALSYPTPFNITAAILAPSAHTHPAKRRRKNTTPTITTTTTPPAKSWSSIAVPIRRKRPLTPSQPLQPPPASSQQPTPTPLSVATSPTTTSTTTTTSQNRPSPHLITHGSPLLSHECQPSSPTCTLTSSDGGCHGKHNSSHDGACAVPHPSMYNSQPTQGGDIRHVSTIILWPLHTQPGHGGVGNGVARDQDLSVEVSSPVSQASSVGWSFGSQGGVGGVWTSRDGQVVGEKDEAQGDLKGVDADGAQAGRRVGARQGEGGCTAQWQQGVGMDGDGDGDSRLVDVVDEGVTDGGVRGDGGHEGRGERGGKRSHKRKRQGHEKRVTSVKVVYPRGVFALGPPDDDPRVSVWDPPPSPYSLIEEVLYRDPWALLLACILLNKTSAKQVRRVLGALLRRFPNARSLADVGADIRADAGADVVGGVVGGEAGVGVVGSLPQVHQAPHIHEELQVMLHPLGLSRMRAVRLVRFSREYLEKQWHDPRELHGVGQYAADAYVMFCRGAWQVMAPPADKDLYKYWAWLHETDGQGVGLQRESLDQVLGDVQIGTTHGGAGTTGAIQQLGAGTDTASEPGGDGDMLMLPDLDHNDVDWDM